MPWKDPEVAKAKRKERYWQTREASIKNAHDWYHTHKHDSEVKQRRADYNDKWREENREKYLAIRKRSREKHKDDPAVKAYKRAYAAKWREKNIRPLVRIAQKAKSGGCIYCGEKAPVALDFHHRDPMTKSFNIGKTLYTGPSEEKLRAEIAKCDVVCANCHIKHHLDEPSSNRKPATEKAVRGQKLRAKKKARWGSFIERAKAAGCSWCPENDPEVLHFHHLNPLAKSFEVMLYTFRPIRVDLPHEVEKTIVLCANCHRKAHTRSRGEIVIPDLHAYWQDRLL